MKRWIVLPYDGSRVARAALRQAASAVGDSAYRSGSAGVLLAVAGVDPAVIAHLVSTAQAVAGAAVPLEVRLLDAGDPVGAFRRLTAGLTDVVVAAPLRPTDCAPWYREACHLGDPGHDTVLFSIRPHELQREEESPHVRSGLGGALGAVLRAGARLRAGMHAPVAGGAA